MKKIYMMTALVIATLSVAVGASANTTIIAPPDGTISVIKAGEGAENYAITNPASSNDIAITKKGSLMLLGGTSLTEAAISSNDGNVTLDIEEPLWADFDSDESNDNITAHSIKTDNGNKYAAATADKNVKIDMSDYSVTSGEITLGFKMLLEDAKKTNLFTVYDENGKKAFEVQLRFRNDENVYVAYTKDKYNYTPLRTMLLPVDEWVEIEAVIDIDNSKVSLYYDSTEIFSAKPMLSTAVPSSLSIGTGADNIAVYSGRKLKNAELRIDTESLSLTNGYDFVSSTLSASVMLFDEYEEIDSKYLYWSAEDNSFCNISPDGILTADISALTAPKTVNVTSVLNCCKDEPVSAQEAITVSAGGSDGQAADTQKCVLTAALSKTSSIAAGDTITVDAVVYNPTATSQTYYVVVPLSDTNGKNIQNHVFKIESAESSGRVSHSFDFDVDSGSSLSAQVFVFDKDFKVNVLR